MILNIPYQSMRQTAEVKTLLDSGAMENLMDLRTVKALQVAKQPLKRPQGVTNADGSMNQAGTLTHFYELHITQGDEMVVQTFFITNLGTDRIILGYPWFQRFSPQIDWANHTLKGAQPQFEAKWYQEVCKRQTVAVVNHVQVHDDWEEGDEIIIINKTNMVQQWAEQAQKDKKETTLSDYYQDYADIFSEEKAKHFPPTRANDHAIKLKLGAPDTIDCKVYPLTLVEREATRKWIEENKEKHYIKQSNSPWSTPWFFIKKKDSSL
jgi:gag-polyprotein putative aspartyl protease